LHREGLATVATFLWEQSPTLAERIAAVAPLAETVEIQIPGEPEPASAVLASLPALTAAAGGPLSLCQVTLAESKGVQMHRRQRFGYKPEALRALNSSVRSTGSPVGRAVVHVDDRDELWELVEVMGEGLDAITGLDV